MNYYSFIEVLRQKGSIMKTLSHFEIEMQDYLRWFANLAHKERFEINKIILEKSREKK